MQDAKGSTAGARNLRCTAASATTGFINPLTYARRARVYHRRRPLYHLSLTPLDRSLHLPHLIVKGHPNEERHKRDFFLLEYPFQRGNKCVGNTSPALHRSSRSDGRAELVSTRFCSAGMPSSYRLQLSKGGSILVLRAKLLTVTRANTKVRRCASTPRNTRPCSKRRAVFSFVVYELL